MRRPPPLTQKNFLPQNSAVPPRPPSHRGKLTHVLSAMGLPKRTAAGTVRLSFGPATTREDIDAAAEALDRHRQMRFPML